VLLLGPDRSDHPATLGDLVLQGLRQRIADGGGHVDHVERRLLRPPFPPVANPERDVVDAQLGQRRLRPGGQLRVALDGPHVLGQQRQERRVIARSGSDIEHAVGGPQREDLEHARDHERLRDRLTAAYRECHIRVCPISLPFGNEALARDRRDRRQHALVGDDGPQEPRELSRLARAHGASGLFRVGVEPFVEELLGLEVDQIGPQQPKKLGGVLGSEVPVQDHFPVVDRNNLHPVLPLGVG
jgi:hypothetical protein